MPTSRRDLNDLFNVSEIENPLCALPAVKETPEKMGWLVVVSSIIASIGGILFGYDIGIISGAMLQLRQEFLLSSFLQEVITSSVLVGAFLSSLFVGVVVDHFGRRISILFTSLLFLVGTAILSFSNCVAMVLVGRFVVGFGIALSSAAECTYISEISPSNYRGLLVSINEFGITLGYLLAYILSYVLISNPLGWRLMFGIAAFPAFLQLVGVACLPPSPYFLVLKGKKKEAEKTLIRLHGYDGHKTKLEAIALTIQEAKTTRFKDLFGATDCMRYRLFVAISLVLLQQFTGNSNVLYYAPFIFQQFGYCSNRSSTLISISLGVVKVVTAAFALSLVDRYGRRKFLFTGSSVMGVCILILGLVTVTTPTTSIYDTSLNDTTLMDTSGTPFLVNETQLMIVTPEVTLESSPQTECQNLDPNIPVAVKVVSALALMGYICGYQFSFGIGTWLVLSEIYPTAVRGRGVALATCVYWGSNFVYTITFLQSIEAVGIGKLFIIYSSLCFLAAIFIVIFVPETKQRTLEEISEDLNRGPTFKFSFLSRSWSYTWTTEPKKGEHLPFNRYNYISYGDS